jgi:hypothetical protein
MRLILRWLCGGEAGFSAIATPSVEMTKFRWVSGTRVQSIIHAEGVRCRGCGSVRTNVWFELRGVTCG